MANMGEVDFYKQMSKSVRCFYKSKSEKRPEPVVAFVDDLEGSEAGKEVLRVLEQVVDYGMGENGIFTEAVKGFYFSDLNKSDYVRTLNNTISYATFYKQLQRGKDEILKKFGTNVMLDLMGLNGRIIYRGQMKNQALLTNYEVKLQRLLGLEEKFYKALQVNIGAERAKCEYKEFTDYQWAEAYQLLIGFTKSGQKINKERLLGTALLPERNYQSHTDEENNLSGLFGYINYLLCHSEHTLSEVDRLRKVNLVAIINM